MARTRDRWTGTFLIKEIGASAKDIIFGVQLDQDPNRIVNIHLPRKSVATFERYLQRACRDLEAHNGHQHNGYHSDTARQRVSAARTAWRS